MKKQDSISSNYDQNHWKDEKIKVILKKLLDHSTLLSTSELKVEIFRKYKIRNNI